MDDPASSFGRIARSLARNPLGIIALFIILVYGLAALMTTFSRSLTANERAPLIWFLIIFPVIVLAVFAWLVTRHGDKIRPDGYLVPGDFKDEKYFIQFQKQKMKAVASLTTASNKTDASTSESKLEEIVDTVERTSQPMVPLHEADNWRTKVLWVDDRPQNNVYERRAFEAFGLRFTLAQSTMEALELLEHNKYASIISDMGRNEGPREGYVLLDAIRKKGIQTPFFIYAGSNLPEHKKEAIEHGAHGSTNDPQELFQQVMNTIVTQT